MWNYHSDVVVETFVRFHPGRSFTLQELHDYDNELFAANDTFFTTALQARGLPNPSTLRQIEAAADRECCSRFIRCRGPLRRRRVCSGADDWGHRMNDQPGVRQQRAASGEKLRSDGLTRAEWEAS